MQLEELISHHFSFLSMFSMPIIFHTLVAILLLSSSKIKLYRNVNVALKTGLSLKKGL